MCCQHREVCLFSFVEKVRGEKYTFVLLSIQIHSEKVFQKHSS